MVAPKPHIDVVLSRVRNGLLITQPDAEALADAYQEAQTALAEARIAEIARQAARTVLDDEKTWALEQGLLMADRANAAVDALNLLVETYRSDSEFHRGVQFAVREVAQALRSVDPTPPASPEEPA